MAHALNLAQRGLGNVWPNPAVGCVIVKDGRILGRGWTQPGGRPHAEARALAQAGEGARGATAYVTLEPCAHHGKTPPCAEALIRAGVNHVVTALTDPDPRVAGGGHAMLRAAGITVTEGVMEAEARRLNEGFLRRVEQGLPHLTLKLATTLDGRIATSSGESRWITGAGARRAVHAMRAQHDAVMVGVGTALADDPDLTVRDLGAVRQPLRIVLDGSLRLSPDSRLGRSARQVPVCMIHRNASDAAQQAWRDVGAIVLQADTLEGALRELARQGLTRIFSEGGATVAASLLTAGLVGEVVTFTAGSAIGGDGVPALGPLHLSALADAPRFWLEEHRRIGGDTLSRWRA
ncbi:bifunctional diaminohydroxyphosphoribosylaminopyrimidine deaminase/5-amino-6-(5-phosphoribosylamino)uracil reductase RibD [Falsirhodobacter sp. 20TX0035]|uniref:bifunctional diaminohydroxyphosphoribosylaminopyrimidine deaminase/5-amino-6-(5-phosphoribosylamino)uracil reductase RibD n=1 Tax=Falsirhodobacter sp. 20TX0035 TaxID=3022019 RepID=UPI00232C84DD|nr:bifunctional diaminohydroxyphosphoribosylaminopyrimidine deaminase/5-amino-6-(5-phosphoribosylamino)uracil reductase RibD [Falsirhodobacter sp. 20TX0035]MDB6453439.1 bifunctional diaminohydroxyphosphoribosylaminopyrimidine deaminase/5-amino-6-(5-phosphoribosylamino)uracil reductase RibD [Falsirhodobacter sp. 20TX0035]